MSKASILIVEDNALIALALKRTLVRQGYSVLAIVDTGEAAVETATSQLLDLILMDIGLAGDMDGIAAAEHIRAFADVPVIFITGNTEDPRLKSTTWLPKPVAEWQLFQLVEQHLQPRV